MKYGSWKLLRLVYSWIVVDLIWFYVSFFGLILVFDVGIWVLIYVSSIVFVFRILWYEKNFLILEYVCSICIYKNIISCYEFLKWLF